MLDKKSPIPIYYQLKENIKTKINKGIWKVGQCIDSERELAEKYDVSRMTVRQALGELVQEGILVREKGKGTFVCEPKVKQKDIMSFSEMTENLKLKAETKVIEFNKINTPEHLKESLKFDEVYKINRLRILEKEIIADEIIYIPCDYCGYIDEQSLKGSFYKILNKFGYEIISSEASIKSILLDDKYRKMFNVEDSVPLLKISSNNYSQNNKLLFVEESIYRSDKYILEVNILKRGGTIK